MDFHTHNLQAPPGTAIVNIPREWLLEPEKFKPMRGGLYSAGIHPWWTADTEALPKLYNGLTLLTKHQQVVRIGECGIDRLKGADLPTQETVFKQQIALADSQGLPVTIHCVRAFDILLRLHKALRPRTRWTIHGFRGGPELARQLLDAGLDLSFGQHFNTESLSITPNDRCQRETDEDF